MTDTAAWASHLARIATIAERNAEHRRNAGLDFNVFRICGVNHYETKHSAILAALLDPAGTHGMGGSFLRLFLSKVCETSLVVSHAVRVRTEVPVSVDDTDDSRLDIIIEDAEARWCVVVENKIYAAEGYRQIERYREWLDRKRNGWMRYLLFLTLDGHAPETDGGVEGSDTVLRLVVWASDILPWLQDCYREAIDKPYVRESIAQYINLVKQLTGQYDMDAEKTKAIVKLATKDTTSFRGYVELLRGKGAAFGQVALQIAESLHSRLKADPTKTWEWITTLQDPFSATDRDAFILLRHARLGFRIRISPERAELRDAFVGIGLEDVGTELAADTLRKKLKRVPRWQSTPSWIGWVYLPDDIRNWDGDFLADFLNGDSRDVVNRILEILGSIDGAV